MMWLLAALRTRVGQAVAAVLAILAAVGAARLKGRSEGRKSAERKLTDADNKNADDIRRRARDADGLHSSDDERGWRDG